MRKMMNKVAGSMKATAAKAVHLLKDKRGENYVDTAVKILIAVVIGALLLAGLYALFGDDYGLTVTMPRTKVPHAEQYKDSVYFADKSMKQQFDQAVEKAYQENVLAPVLDQDEAEEEMEQEESAGMNMGM